MNVPVVGGVEAALHQLMAQLGLVNGYLYVLFHPNLVIASLIERTVAPLGEIWFDFILQTTDFGASGGPFTHNLTIQSLEPKVQLVANAGLGLIAIWSGYRIMWGHGLFTQYTARILLPRLFMAAVLVNFSLTLIQMVVDASNVISAAVEHMIVIDPPSSMLAGFLIVPNVDPLELITVAALAAAFDVLAIVYVLRYAILIVLGITAPLAALVFMLPETAHLSKLWMSQFTTNLFMQPIQLFVLSIGFTLEKDAITPVHHLFAIASLLIVFKVPGVMGGSEKVAHKLESTVSKGLHHLAHALVKA